MAAKRSGRSSTAAILSWAALMLGAGLGLGLLLGQPGCGRRARRESPREEPSRPAEGKGRGREARPGHEGAGPSARKDDARDTARDTTRAGGQQSPAPGGQEGRQPKPPEASRPVLALVIDDLGYAAPELVTRLCAQPHAFSVAVLPFQEHTRASADIAFGRGKEVLLHLPMEPLGYPGPHKDPGPGAILFNLPENEVRARVRKALDDVPHRRGVNNHMGSRITPDRARMGWVLQEVRAFRCFFLDSRTEKDSVAGDVARSLGIPTLQRQVFLDDDKRFAEMEKQWERALAIARKDGQVVVIGHIYPETVEALERLLPRSAGSLRYVKAGELAR